MSEYLSKIVYLTEAQYASVISGTPINGHSYDPSAIYITPKTTAGVSLVSQTGSVSLTGATQITDTNLQLTPVTISTTGDVYTGGVVIGGTGYKGNTEGGEIRFDPPVGGQDSVPTNLPAFTIDTVYDTWTGTAHQGQLNLRFVAYQNKEIWIAGESGVLYGAAWNDYAEARQSKESEPGRCVQENDDGWLTKTDKRLIPGASIISDTYGFSQGETKTARTPIAVSGRVLAHPYRDRKEYHAGMCVCSAPNGTVDIMTREEIKEYPDCIIGIVSEVPDYDTWGANNIKVNNRIWVRVK